MTADSNGLKLIEQDETVKIKDINPSFWNQQYNHYYNEEEEETSEEDDDDDSQQDEKPICGCGKALSAGWNCTQCRYNCPTCHRALSPEEICSRCHVKRDTN